MSSTQRRGDAEIFFEHGKHGKTNFFNTKTTTLKWGSGFVDCGKLLWDFAS